MLTALAPRDPLPPGPCLLCVRPHAIRLAAGSEQPGGENMLPAMVRTVQWQGDLHAIDFEVAGHAMRLVCTPLREPPHEGAKVFLSFSADDATLIPGDHV